MVGDGYGFGHAGRKGVAGMLLWGACVFQALYDGTGKAALSLSWCDICHHIEILFS